MQDGVEQHVDFMQLLGARADLFFEAGIEFEDAGFGSLLRGDVAHGLGQADQCATVVEQGGYRDGYVQQTAVLA